MGTMLCTPFGLACTWALVRFWGLNDSRMLPGDDEPMMPSTSKTLLTFRAIDIFLVKLNPAAASNWLKAGR